MMFKRGEWQRGVSGYMTVYLSLCLAVMISVCLAAIEGVRYNAVLLEAQCVADIGMNSVMAEYHRELWKRFGLLALDSSYGTGATTKKNIEEHYRYYLDKNLSAGIEKPKLLDRILYKDFLDLSAGKIEVTKGTLLTDFNGQAFRRQAAQVYRDEIGLTLVDQMKEWVGITNEKQLLTRNLGKEREETVASIQEFLDTPSFESPTEHIDQKRNMDILSLVLPSGEQISYKQLQDEYGIANRIKHGETNVGNSINPYELKMSELEERVFFNEYLFRHMGHYGNEKQGGVLAYELEYLCFGKPCDADNLQAMATRLCAMREVANLLYLSTNSQKVQQAKVLGLLVAMALECPEAEDACSALILMGWSFMESLYDVKQLLAGNRVPLLKDDQSWHYGIENAMAGTLEVGQNGKIGLSYEDYMRIYLLVLSPNEVTGRAMNIVESEIRTTPGNLQFRLDGCYCYIETTAEIQSGYGYQTTQVWSNSYD